MFQYNPMFNPAPFTPDEIIRAIRYAVQTGLTSPASREAETQGLLTYSAMFSAWIITPRGHNYITGHEENLPRTQE